MMHDKQQLQFYKKTIYHNLFYKLTASEL